MSNSLTKLSVSGSRIVNSGGHPINLRGVCLGGWMNMENFINGYPGSEHGLRATMAQILGPEKSQFFFERLLEHFITEADIAFIKNQGATVVRIPFNYRHFEDDSRPFQYREAGFTRLDRLIEWCTQNQIYAVLDMHAAPGWQNPDWHSDNASRHTLLWEHPHFQDRLVALWSAIAERYCGNPTVAGYDLLNEPVIAAPRGVFTDTSYHPEWERMNQLYRRLVAAIRSRDADTPIFLEGDFFASNFDGLEAPFAENLVYSSHIYNPGCFGPGPYPGPIRGETWDAARQQQQFDRHPGTVFSHEYGVPLLVGECGAIFNGPADETPGRLRAFDDQLSIFNAAQAHWTTWTYKDVGIMGWVALDPTCEYMQRLAGVLDMKRQLDTDFWLEWSTPTPAKLQAADLARLITDTIADPELPLADVETYFRQASLSNFAGELLQTTYAKCFVGLSEVEIDRILQSFRLENCCVHQELVGIVGSHLASAPNFVPEG